mmetsp:Transcript_92557/g.238954  ORF Transcript_92557/g.238954 Transcript_92557/m.238954 type:complete len:434 (-) Transcript_92557:3108-4409(-)
MDAGQATATRILGRLLEQDVLGHAKGARLKRDVVGDEHNVAAPRILWRRQRALPSHNAAGVLPRVARRLLEDALRVGHQLHTAEQVRGHRHIAAGIVVGGPLLDQLNLHHAQELRGIGGASSAGDLPLRLHLRRSLSDDRALRARGGIEPLHGRPSVRVNLLQQAQCFQVLAGHGRGRDAQGVLPSLLANANLDHNLVNLRPLQTATMLGDEHVQELLHHGIDLDWLHIDQGHKVHEEAAVWPDAHLGVQARALQLIHSAEQERLRPRHPIVTRHVQCVREHADEDRARLAHLAPRRAPLADAKEDLRVAPDGRDDALQVIVLRQAVHLQEVAEGWPHVTAGIVLGPAVGRQEARVARHVRRLRKHDTDLTNASRLERRAPHLQQALNVLHQLFELHIRAEEAQPVGAERIRADNDLHGVAHRARFLQRDRVI